MGGAQVTVVGIGADGWDGLSPGARHVLDAAEVIVGSARQLALLPDSVPGLRHRWPTPMLDAVPGLLAEFAGRRLAVLASGDPMFYGVGATLVRAFGAGRVDVLPHPSALSLACARLGWAIEDVEVVSAVGRPLALLHPAVQPGRRVLVLVADKDGAAAVAELLTRRGFGPSELTLLEQLGGAERRVSATAEQWREPPHDPLAVVAVECRAAPGAMSLPRTPGLPESAYDTDGQITKRALRALALAHLAPVPGQLLWDVGAGSGSIGIEWLRTHPSCRAIAVEARADRRERIAANALALGVPGLQIVAGSAPDALAGLPAPDAVFVGGAVSVDGVLDACLAALRPGGRLVAHAVTLESESTLAGWHHRLGGELTRFAVQHAEPIGHFRGWRPAMPVTQWSYPAG